MSGVRVIPAPVKLQDGAGACKRHLDFLGRGNGLNPAGRPTTGEPRGDHDWTIVIRITKKTTTLTSGSRWPSRMAPKIHSGSVFCAPAVNVVTMTSSKERAKASKAPATSAVEISGRVTSTNDRQPLAPRSIAASSNEEEVRRSRARTLL